MKTATKVFCTIIVILIISFGLMFLAYKFDSFPGLKTTVDSIFSKNNSDAKDVSKSQSLQNEPPKELKKLATINDTAITVSETDNFENYNNLLNYDCPLVIVQLLNNNHTIRFIGDNNFVLNFESQIISSPYIFSDLICLITSDNVLNVIDPTQNALINKIDLNFIVELQDNLENPIFATNQNIFVKSINKKNYKISFESVDLDSNGDFAHADSTNADITTNADFERADISKIGDFAQADLASDENLSSQLKASFYPNDNIKEFMISQINTWGFETKIDELPELRFFAGFEKMPINDLNVHIFVYTPDFPSHYEIGLTNEKSALIRGNAIVAIFTEKGELLSLSLDYVADNPVVNATLSNNEFYYIVAGWAFNDSENLETVYMTVSETIH